MDSSRFGLLKLELQALLEAGSEQRAEAVERVGREDAALGAQLAAWLAAADQGAGEWLERPAVLDLGIEDEPPATPVPERIGPWRLEAEIGRGGMGHVFRGRRDDGAFDQVVAIKLVRADLPSEILRRRFLAERRTLAALVHPNIARLLDGGATAAGVPYLVLEHVAGEPIDRYCDRLALSVEARLRLFVDVCRAVHFAHQKLVLHGDIKAPNVLVDESGEAKLLDFGIARLLVPSVDDADWTALGMPQPLTPEWASPEQLRGDALLTTASDVYSLGVLLHVLLTGTRPHRFAGQSPEAFAREIFDRGGTPALGADDLPSPPGVDRRRWRGDLQRIVARALAPEVARRYGAVAELEEDLERYLAGRPVAAHPPSVPYRLGKLVRRHRAAAAASALAVLALLAGLLATSREAQRARRGEARARLHFAQVRQLANAALFELHDAIRELPGSLAARQALVRHSLEYLAVLAEEAREDPTLHLDLATAYRKVGDVQGGIFLASSGDTAAASGSYELAAQLLDRIAEEGEGDPARAAALADELLAVSDGFQSIGDFARAAAVAERAVALRLRLPAAVGATPRARLQLGVAHVRLGRARREQGRRDSAFAATRSGLVLLAPLVADPAHLPEARRQLAKAQNQLGSLLDDPRSALAAHEQALAIQTGLVAAEPQSAQLARELAWTLGDMTRPLSLLGETARVESNLQRAAAIFERQIRQYPDNAIDQIDLASVLTGIGWARTAAGDFVGARAVLARAQGLAEAARAADPASTWASEVLWQVYSQLGDTSAADAAASSDREVSRARRERAADWYARSRAVLAALAESSHREARYAADLEDLGHKMARDNRELPAAATPIR